MKRKIDVFEYAKDITYITNTELGFDYLRDNMAQRMEDKVQKILQLQYQKEF